MTELEKMLAVLSSVTLVFVKFTRKGYGIIYGKKHLP